uniref:Putative ovule protein n=2 Tax=Solanum chacoense TaxID=4108 RepID=A0A0V0IA92_SOLCH
MKKMESKKLRGPRWWDSFVGPKNSNSKWVQENLEEMNRNVTRMLKVIENSSAESFARKVEIYYERRQELIKLVVKCYSIHCSLAERCNHGTGEVLNYIPNSHLIRSHAPDITSPPLLSQRPSSKQFNVHNHERSVSKQLKRGVSVKGSNYHINDKKEDPKPCCLYMGPPVYGSYSQLPMPFPFWLPSEPPYFSNYYSYTQSELQYEQVSNNYSDTRRELQQEEVSNYYSDTQSDDDDEEELEAELRDMIVKLYIQLEGDRIDKALLEEMLDLNVNSKGGIQSQQPVKISMPPPPLPPVTKIISSKSQSESDDSFSSSNYSDTQNNDDDGDELGHDELEAELHNMIEKLYIELEWDRVVSMFQGEILKYEDNTHDDDEEFLSSNVDKALLEENLKLQAEISRLLKKKSYNEEIEAIVAERDMLKARVARLTADLRMYLEGIDVNPCSPI